MLHTVTSITKKINHSIRPYICGLLLSSGRKNCESMSRETGVKKTDLYAFLNNEWHQQLIKKGLVNSVKAAATKENPGKLIVDDTNLTKRYAFKIEGLTYDHCNSVKGVVRGIVPVTIAWTNGKITIPLDFKSWVRKKEMNDENSYKKKIELALELIEEYRKLVPFSAVLVDGAYISEASIQWFIESKCNFIGRFSRNRRVVVNGKNIRIDKCFEPRFKRNRKYSSSMGHYKGLPCRFIACKRKGKNGKPEIIFFATNISIETPKDIIRRYNLRWGIEKFFRTGKQKLGLGQCQSRKIEKQSIHIFAVFLAHAIAEEVKIYEKKKSSDHVLNLIRRQKMDFLYSQNPLVPHTCEA